MKSRKKFIPHLLIALLALFGEILFVNTFEPSSTLDIKTFTIPSVIPFFFLLFLAVGGIATFVLSSARRGILTGILIVGFLLLQYLRVNNIFYTALLIIILLLIEFLFWKKK